MSTYWEWYFIATIALWTVLFPAGGTELPATKQGYKWLRRYVAPAITLCLLLLCSVVWWRSLLCCGLLSGAMTLPYGSKSSWLVRALTAVCMALPTLILGWSWFTPVFPVVFLALFALSSWKPKQFPWVVVCALYVHGAPKMD